MILSKDAQTMIEASALKSELEEVLKETQALLVSAEIKPTEIQYTVMINHINEMLRRAKNGDTIPEVEPEMFAEISAESKEIAAVIVERIGNLPIAETFLLSIHFETAKQN